MSIYACCSVVLSIALVPLALMLGDPVAMPTDLVREVQLWDAGSRTSSARLRDVASSSRVAVARALAEVVCFRSFGFGPKTVGS